MTARRDWIKLVAAAAAIFGVFHVLADALGSTRGEAGLLVGAVIVALVLAADRALFRGAWVALDGLRAPAPRGLIAVAIVAVLLLAVIPAIAAAAGGTLVFYPGWVALLPGLFAQGGIAEELLFRGFLFAHLRRGRSFWRATLLAMIPFVAAHLLLFWVMPWPIALASTALAVVISIPMARLFELGGGTIWAPAALHFVVQGALKVVSIEGPGSAVLPMAWFGATAALPFLVFAIRQRT